MEENFYDINSEYCLLSQAFFDTDIVNKLIDELNIDDFYSKEHQHLFIKIKELYNKNENISCNNILSILNNDKILTYDFLLNISKFNSSLDANKLIEILLNKK